MRRGTAVALAFLALGAGAFSDVPVRSEQVIYAIVAFNGKDYSPTFVPGASDTIYVLANTDNFVSVHKTFVYWWPPTGRWQTEASVFNELQLGILEVRDGRGAPRLFGMERYTYFNVRGEYEQNWKVAVGDAADAEVRRSQDLTRAYLADVEGYRSRREAYLAQLRSLSTRIEELRARKQDFSALKDRMDSLPAPLEPQPPREYLVPPTPVQGAFVLNLPPGRYRVRFLDKDAAVMEGSEKWIVSHLPRRTNGVGYEVIPSDKWTRPEESKELSSVLYVNGRADLYVTPFFEHEYNDLDYARTTDNGAPGNPRIYSWNRIQQVPRALLTLRAAGGDASRLREEPFLVQQSEGAGLGYTIVPFTGSADQEGKTANLKAFHLRIPAGSRSLELRAFDESGRFLPGSDRRIQIVEPGRGAAALIAMVLSPLAVMVIVLIVRGRLYSGKRRHD